MSTKEDLLLEIIDDIEAGMIDDPLEDYKYLNDEAEKYKEHELAEEIYKAIGKMIYVDIPAMARKGLKNDLSGDVNAYNALINEAHALMIHGQWNMATVMLENLIGDGIGVEDSEKAEFRTIEDEVQQILYKHFFKSQDKEVITLPIDLGMLYGLYGCALVELQQFEAAEKILENSLRYNPMNLNFFFEYSESIKAQGKLDIYEELSRKYLSYAYRAVDIGHLYRNLGYAYIEKEDYETAIMLYSYSQAYDPESNVAEQELEYIAQKTGSLIKDPTQEEADAVLNRETIQIGVSKKVLEILYRNAYVESHLNHDVEKTEYFCKMLFDVTRDEGLVKELLDVAKDSSRGFGGLFGNTDTDGLQPTEYQSPYDKMREDSLKEVFPDFPSIEDCRLKITFTINSTKYEETIYQILSHVSEMSKLIDNKDVTVYFADLKSVTENINYVNDLMTVAGGWKSFRLTINECARDKYQFRYFTDYLKDKFGVASAWNGTAEEIRKKYKKASAPKRAKKQSLEDGYEINLKGCSPQEIVTGLASTYASVYLSEYDVKAIRVSDEEIILSANDEFVVDFWVSPYGYGQTMTGEPDGAKPYEFCTYLIQELTRNDLFKYNASAFRRIFYGERLEIESLRFNGPDYYRPEINHFYKINEAYPELHLQEKYDAYQGDPYTFIIFEMENADGSIGHTIGFTDKKPRTLLVKICKELETRTPSYLEGNGAPGLMNQYSKSFIQAFLSWKGEKKTKRLEKHLKYYCFEKILKDKNDAYDVAKAFMAEANEGKHDGIIRKNYADIGRR